MSGKNVAILLWGDAFRPARPHWDGGQANCVIDSMEAQREATTSQRMKLVHPLRHAGAHVHVLLTFPVCDQHNLTQVLQDTLIRWLGRQFVVATSLVYDAGSLEEAMRAAWQLLWRHVTSHGGLYDYTLLTRHDIYQQYSFDAWPPSTIIKPARGHNLSESLFAHMRILPRRSHEFERVLFESPCRQCDRSCNCGVNMDLNQHCRICTNDHQIWVPAHYIKDVVKAANTTDWSGHLFYRRSKLLKLDHLHFDSSMAVD